MLKILWLHPLALPAEVIRASIRIWLTHTHTHTHTQREGERMRE